MDQSAHSTQKILIIDDDVSLHDLCIAMLSRIGYQCASTYSGEEGLARIKEEPPDVILLDYRMPGIDGRKVFEKLTESPEFEPFKHIPVVMLTGIGRDEQLKNELLRKGVAAYLNKPFGVNELVNVIQNVLITHPIKLRNIRLKEEIARSKHYLELIIDHAPLGIIVVDLEGKISRLNSFFLEFFGISHAREMVGKSIFEQMISNKPEVADLFEKALQTKRSCSIPTIEIHNFVGERLTLNIQCVPFREESGDITGTLSIWEDVTHIERRAYEMSVLRQIGEAMQRVLDLDILLHLILTSITAGCALGFSRSIIFMINEKTDLLEGRMGVGPLSEREAQQIWAELAKDHENLDNFLTKFGLARPDVEDPFNSTVRKLHIHLDKEHDVLANTIRTRESKWIHNSNQLKEEGLTVDTAFAEFFHPEEFVTVPLVAKNRVLGVVIADNKYSGVPLRDERISLLKLMVNQASLAIENAEAYRRLEGKVQELADTLRQLREMQDKLVRSEQLATVGKMAAHVAHEIRNPLTAIGGFTNSILKDLADSESVEQSARIISKEVQRLENILRNVLDFTKISRPNKRLHNINSAIEEIVILQHAALDEKVQLRADLSPFIPEFLFDEEQMKQALMNVLTNSISSIKEDGAVTIRTYLSDETAAIEISDTGVGMTKETLDNIFNPFYSQRRDGTGLGLAVTQSIVEGHDGRIEVESEPEKGTTFRIILPLVFIEAALSEA